MHYVRLYTKLNTDGQSTSTQTEVARSEPNAMPPKVNYEVPAELEVTSIEIVAGYGNVDVVLHVNHLLIDPREEKEEHVEAQSS
jgi:hypothetical protein